MPASAIATSTPPIVGRAAELDRIAALRAAGEVPGVVLCAPAGVGKSRVAREAVATAQRAGALVEWVQATRSAAAVPLAAFAGLLPLDVRSNDLLELMRQSIGALRSRAEGGAIVLGVDDAQLLDPVSATLVHHLASTRTAFLVVTVRAGEPCPDAIESLWKDAGAVRLELQPLDEADTALLAEGVLGGSIEQRATRWLFEQSQGNPMWARELLIGAVANGSIEAVRGFWRMSSRPPVTGTLTELVDRRLGVLAVDGRAAIELLALGEPLPLELVVDLVGADGLRAAEAQRLVIASGAAAMSPVRLAHPLYGEVVRASLPASRTRDLQLRLAHALLERPPLTSDDELRVARWLLDAGEDVPPGLLEEAAATALGAGDPDLAAELASQARRRSPGMGSVLVLARAEVARKRFAEAEALLAATRAEIDDPDVAMEYLDLYVDVVHWGLGRSDDLDPLLEQAQRWWPDPAWRQRLLPLRLYVAELGRPRGSSVGLSEQILRDPDLDPEVRRRVENFHAAGLFFAGRTVEAMELAVRRPPPVPLARPNDDFALSNWCIGIEAGLLPPGHEEQLGELLRRAVRAGDVAATGIVALAIGTLHHAAGRLVDAARWLDEAELQFERHDVHGSLCTVRARQVQVAVERGRPDVAAAALARTHATLDGRRVMDAQTADLALAEAWERYGAGDALEAQRRLLEGARRSAPIPLFAVQLAYAAMRAGAPASVALREADEPASRCDAPLAIACTAHIRARADRDGAAVLDASAALESIGSVSFALEAAAHAAQLFAEAGREDSARRASARARALLERTNGRVAPHVAGIDATQVELTTRERQLLDLARQGLSNAEIAERLVISVRTVESHLYRGMQKLGVGDRRDL